MSCIEFSGDEKYSIFEPKKFMDIWYFLITGKFCLDFFGNRKYGLFWAKKLIERWYLLVTEKFLFWTFRWWEIRSFFQPKSWWKGDIYLIFSSFPRYSRTWEIWFFSQRMLWAALRLVRKNTHDQALCLLWTNLLPVLIWKKVD